MNHTVTAMSFGSTPDSTSPANEGQASQAPNERLINNPLRHHPTWLMSSHPLINSPCRRSDRLSSFCSTGMQLRLSKGVHMKEKVCMELLTEDCLVKDGTV